MEEEYKINTSIEAMKKHSKRVKAIYMFCIFLIISGVLALFLQFYFNSPKETTITKIIADSSEMISPEYKGKTDDGNEYSITSKRAKEVEEGIILLSAPIANMLGTEDSRGFVLDSVTGMYDDIEKELILIDNVALDDDEGNSFRGSEIKMDLEKNIIYSDNKIDLTGKIGKISADGLEIKNEGDTIIFKGNTKMIISDTTKVGK